MKEHPMVRKNPRDVFGHRVRCGLALAYMALAPLPMLAADKVRLQLKWQHAFQFAGYYAAEAQGYYREAGLEVEIVPATPGEDPRQQVVQGKAEFGVGATDLLLLRAEGAPVVVLASIFQHSPQAFMVLRKQGLQSIHDLAGSKVMVEPDSAELLAYLQQEGVSIDRRTLLPHSFDVQDLLSGKVDAMSVYAVDEPFVAGKAGRDYLLYSPRAAGIDFYSDNLFTTEAMVTERPELTRRFLAASLRGWDYAMQHQEELIQLIHRRYSQRRSLDHLRFEARQMEPLLQTGLVEIGHMNPGRWRYIAEIYAEMGMLKPDLDLEGFLYDADPPPRDLTWLYGVLGAVAALLLVVTLVAARFARLLAALRESNAEREQALAKLKAGERKYRSLTESMKDVVWTLDTETTRLLYVSPSIQQLRGITPEEAIAEPVSSAFTAEQADRMEKAMHQRVAEFLSREDSRPKFYTDEAEVLRKDGTTVWTEMIQEYYVNHETGRVELRGVARDISERKGAEERLHSIAMHEKAILATVPDIIMEVDNDKVYTWANSAGEKFFGPDVVGKRADEFFVGQQDTLAIVQRLFDGDEQVVYLESWQRRRDGNERLLAWWCHTRKDPLGQVLGTISTARDITQHKLAEEALRESEEKRRRLFETMMEGVFYQAADGSLIDANAAALQIFGLSRDEFLSRTSMHSEWDVISEDGMPLPGPKHPSMLALSTGKPVHDLVVGILNPQTEAYTWVSASAIPEFLEGESTPHQVVVTMHDLTERKQAEEELRASQHDFQQLFDSMASGLAVHEIILDEAGTPCDYRFIQVNPAFEALTGLKADTVVGRTVCEVLPEIEPSWIERYGRVALTGEPAAFEEYSGELGRHYRVVAYRPKPHHFAVIVDDITEQKESEEERVSLERQLQQVQKTESIGRLAGGVAHDFNNMLAVILGHSELALEQMDPSLPFFSDLQEIQKAATRSADLTKQLLAFAREQTVAPEILDLNETVMGMLRMLQRLIGEDVDLDWRPDTDLWPVKVDPSQIDHVLANLCVNARDAITGIGNVTIEAVNSVLDEAYCADHAETVPGEYVLISVSDNGCGMDKDTLAHIFEPFFTTKQMGRGTGLGLATVYGIVKQNNGFINAYSEPDMGTTIKVYLPRHVGSGAETHAAGTPEPAQRGNETILLAEDEPGVLTIATQMLEGQGYTVLVARTPGEAIRLAKEHTGEIHLLMTDVVMPEMNGQDLAKILMSIAPQAKRLFTSGYTANVIADHGVLDDGVHFIQKPFSRRALANKVREVLDHK